MGWDRYAHDNGHVGLTTLRRENVTLQGVDVRFDFIAKSGKRRRMTVRDQQSVRVLADQSDGRSCRGDAHQKVSRRLANVQGARVHDLLAGRGNLQRSRRKRSLSTAMQPRTAPVREMKADGLLPEDTKVRTSKYLNNLIEQDHRNVKSRTNVMLGFKRFRNAAITLAGIELMHRIRKDQFNLVKLSLKDTAARAVWNAVLSAR